MISLGEKVFGKEWFHSHQFFFLIWTYFGKIFGQLFREVALFLLTFPSSWNGQFWSYPLFHYFTSLVYTFLYFYLTSVNFQKNSFFWNYLVLVNPVKNFLLDADKFQTSRVQLGLKERNTSFIFYCSFFCDRFAQKARSKSEIYI